MVDALAWLQSSPLGVFMNESGPWIYPVVNVVHVLGVAALFGAVLVLDLRLVGMWPRAPLPPIAAVVTPVATAGFLLAATSGVCLLAANAVEYADNPVLLIKFAAIAAGIGNAVAVRRTRVWRALASQEPGSTTRQLRVAGGLSIVCWLTAVTAGRMIGYWY